MPQGGRVINTSPNTLDKRGLLSALSGAALDILLPPQCPSCNAVVESAGVLCGPCWQAVDFITPPLCSCCGLPFAFDPGLSDAVLCGACARRAPPYNRARAVMVYGDFSRKLVLAFKHGDRTDTAPGLGRWLARTGAGLIADADLIAPVPLHWSRLFARRYNQAALLAGVVGRIGGVRVVQDLLVRGKRTPPQGRLTRSARHRNVQGAFRVRPSRRGELDGRRVLLIDDVLTTGATVSACAKMLLRGGAKAVDVLTLARVVRTTEAGR
ncbi:MAG: ComF family protein [Rhodospirillales bacterium]|nr:ComF family protein [Alphaproteobacteria bacterium]MBL6947036.1 ComF family protein [Rhodospirillales bacterium]